LLILRVLGILNTRKLDFVVLLILVEYPPIAVDAFAGIWFLMHRKKKRG